ncbi:glycosyltransferase [Candidatus Symbiopectobacterium sp. NZEC127]|uniref:glycosyltransferase n=1 Tax=Candidatus Symbiopectobacterium sp. NZEC127 TaxID=2820472 RepID=UPI002225E8B4|nr:glycosyltransferase [Candidatus Symbiopectobacterium sp. NZEC127]
MQFSVLMSVYKNELPDHFNACFASLEKQTLQPNEIILVVDGVVSSDLYTVIKKWNERLNLKTIQLNRNVGLGSALNIGLQHCQYKIVARMDTDDVCVSTRFEKQINFLLENPEVCVLGTAVREFDETMSFSLGQRVNPLHYEEIKEMAKKRNPFNHMSVMFKRDMICSVGGYLHHAFMEDYNLWLRVLASGYKVGNLVEPLVYVRAGRSMIQRRKGLVYISSEYKLFKLKLALGLDNRFMASYIFILRASARMLPTKFLSKLYCFFRK